MIGPNGVSRATTVRSNHQRTRTRSWRSVIWLAGSDETSNKSLDAARKLVPPQAMSALRPMAKNGSPGPIRPTALKDGDLTPASTHRLGRKMPRWGSLAISAPPVALRVPATAKELLPDRLRPVRMSPSSAN